MQGKVVEVQESHDRYGNIHHTSIIHFQAQEEAARTRKIKLVNTQLDVGTLLPICYDPFFPRYRRSGEWSHPFSSLLGSMAMAGVALIGFGILLGIWFFPRLRIARCFCRTATVVVRNRLAES